jgi:flavodoxin/NAD-dependent dihydropyrimidine dehydrogenase PreA subunit
MSIKKVWAMYFSPTGNTKKVADAIADTIASAIGAARQDYSFTLPKEREGFPEFTEEDLVVFGSSTYAGRIPNLMLKYVNTVMGNGAYAVPIVTYGNRNFDDSLIELRDILSEHGFKTIAAGAFIGEHSFSKILGAGRPDGNDADIAKIFASQVAGLTADLAALDGKTVDVDGVPNPYRGYYQPRDRKGEFIDIRKVKPKINDDCTDCKICADNCPMGCIDHENVRNFDGICIKCCACEKLCPVGAIYYDDPGYLYHKTELEEEYTRRAEPKTFLSA